MKTNKTCREYANNHDDDHQAQIVNALAIQSPDRHGREWATKGIRGQADLFLMAGNDASLSLVLVGAHGIRFEHWRMSENEMYLAIALRVTMPGEVSIQDLQ